MNSSAGERQTEGTKPKKAYAGPKEKMLPVEEKKPAAKKAVKDERATERRKAG